MVDTIQQLVTFYTESLQAYYLLSAEQTTGESELGMRPDQWFRFYPNPADRGITIEFTVPLGQADITLMDAEGRVVNATRMDGISKGSSSFLSTTRLPAGTYYLRVSSGNRVEGWPVAILR